MWMKCGQRRADPLSKTTIEEISEKAVKKKIKLRRDSNLCFPTAC